MPATNTIPVICIDGPGGSGKGTIGARLSERLGWEFLDSGALYRLVALSALKRGIDIEDEDKLAELAKRLDARFAVQKVADGIEHFTYLGKEEVTSQLRTETTGGIASKVARLQKVRDALLQRQRDFRVAPGLVCDGRDMGTVVFPDAHLKIYLTASAEERAKRRVRQLKSKGIDANLSEILADISTRDHRDMNRAVAPLKPADDAVIIDTTQMSVDQVDQRISALVKERFQIEYHDAG